MFLLNSRLGLFTAAPSCLWSKSNHTNGAPLLPKLRGQFAEFLNVVSLAHLGLLDLPTCVGLRYGRLIFKRLEAFLGSVVSTNLFHSEEFSILSTLQLTRYGFAYISPIVPNHNPISGWPNFLRPSYHYISTVQEY